tara:strand:- start:5990 stop:6517 length:528 start_codon:yes stop_codon:yes gene_type:complete
MKFRTIKIHGKDYVEVSEKIKYFRKEYIGWSLTADIVELTEKRVVMTSTIKNPDGFVVASGTAYENEGSTHINKTSFIENCETSANGRALSNFGIGIDSGIASADEVKNAINQEKSLKDTIVKIAKPNPVKLTEDKFTAILKALEEGKAKEVKKRLPNYILSKSQEGILKQLIEL